MPDMTGNGKLYVVLVNWNGWHDTVECLESLYRSSYERFQVVVVDNGSTDASAERIAAWARGELSVWCPPGSAMRRFSSPPVAKPLPYLRLTSEGIALPGEGGSQADATAGRHPLVLIESPTNLGFGNGNNLALRYISLLGDFDHVWLLNNDTVVPEDAMARMVDAARRRPGITGSVLRHYADPERVQAYGGGYFAARTGKVVTEHRSHPEVLDFVNGASFMLGREVLDAVGLFDDRIFMYFEENDYCIRAARRNVACHCSDAVVYHKVGASSSCGSYFSWFNVYRNKYYSLKKNYGLGVWTVVHLCSLALNAASPFAKGERRRACRDALWETVLGRSHRKKEESV